MGLEPDEVMKVLNLVKAVAVEGLNLFLVDCSKEVKSFHLQIII